MEMKPNMLFRWYFVFFSVDQKNIFRFDFLDHMTV